MTSSSLGGTSGITLSLTQGPSQLAGGGDQPPDKNIPLDKTCQDGLTTMTRLEVEVKKKKIEEPKDTQVLVAQ